MKKAFFLVLLAGFLPTPAFGQIQVTFFQNPLILGENKDVQKDLKFTDDQVKKLADLSKAYADGIKGLGFQTQDIEKRKVVNAAAMKGLTDTLDGAQTKRLKQLELQQRGANAFIDPQIVKDLVITREQRGAIVTTLQGFTPKWIAIIQGAKGNQQEIQKKMAEVHRDLSADVVKRLTPDQQTKWRDIAGPPFAGAFPFMMPVFIDQRPQPVLAWHMNDLSAAQAEAKKTGKPIFVTFRCEA